MSFAGWLLEQASARGDALALVDARGSISYRALYDRTRATAAQLLAELPAQPRAIVPILGENSIDLVVAYLATLWAGALPALVPPMSKAALDAVLKTTQASLVLGDAERLASLEGVRAVEVSALATREAPTTLPDAAPQAALALLLFTSGSTGAPRGVMLSASNLSENTREIASALSLGAEERTLSSLPIYYCYGTSVLHAHLRAGATVFFDAFRFPEDAVKRIAEERISFVPGVPSLFEVLARRSSLGQGGATPAKIMISGGRTAPGTLAALRKRLPATRIYLRYGVTELTSAASILAPELLDAKLGSIGRGLPSYPLFVLRADGTPVSPGEPGEIVARGPCVTLGYFQDPEATAKAFRDGAFHTGDLARVDEDGYVYVLGRQQEFIKSAGHRISPHEIEDAIATHADVVEVAVCAEPDALRGEMPVALVVLRAGAANTTLLLAHAELLLPRFKVPGRFVVVDALPRTASGKLRREALPALLAPKT